VQIRGAGYSDRMYKAGDLATRLKVHPNTLRNWGDESVYAPYLSNEAKGRAPGAKRRFTERDALVLATIAFHRDIGLKSDQIAQLLADGKLLEALPTLPADMPPAEREARDSIQLVTMPEYIRVMDLLRSKEDELGRVIGERDTAVRDKDAAQGRISDLQREIGQLQGRLEALEQERQPASYWVRILLIAVIGVLIVGGLAIVFLAARTG
jgi:DNA-binding transcriptional MerR regulator